MIEYRAIGYRDVLIVDHGTGNTLEFYPKREVLYQGHESGMDL